MLLHSQCDHSTVHYGKQSLMASSKRRHSSENESKSKRSNMESEQDISTGLLRECEDMSTLIKEIRLKWDTKSDEMGAGITKLFHGQHEMADAISRSEQLIGRVSTILSDEIQSRQTLQRNVDELNRKLSYLCGDVADLRAEQEQIGVKATELYLKVNGLDEGKGEQPVDAALRIFNLIDTSVLRSDIDVAYRMKGEKRRNSKHPDTLIVRMKNLNSKQKILSKKDILKDRLKYPEGRFPKIKFYRIYDDVPKDVRFKRSMVGLLSAKAIKQGADPSTTGPKGDKLKLNDVIYKFDDLHLIGDDELTVESLKVVTFKNTIYFQGERAYLSIFFPARFHVGPHLFHLAEQAYFFFRSMAAAEMPLFLYSKEFLYFQHLPK